MTGSSARGTYDKLAEAAALQWLARADDTDAARVRLLHQVSGVHGRE